jgi:probable F420-dependent oxidoreductase
VPPERLAELAVVAERLGYRKVWLPDHLLPPGQYGTRFGGVYEPLLSLAYIAARTRTIGLGTSVLVLPLRSPFVVAKQAATLDRLSGGRLTLGVGIGWERTEFAAVGVDFRERAARTDEAIALLRHLFYKEGPFEGRFYAYETGVFEPRPDREIPLMVGGTSDAALRRAATVGDEWQAFALDPAGFGERLARLRALSDRRVRATTRIGWPDGAQPVTAVVDQVNEFAAAGAEVVAVSFGAEPDVEKRMTELADAIGLT